MVGGFTVDVCQEFLNQLGTPGQPLPPIAQSGAVARNGSTLSRSATAPAKSTQYPYVMRPMRQRAPHTAPQLHIGRAVSSSSHSPNANQTSRGNSESPPQQFEANGWDYFTRWEDKQTVNPTVMQMQIQSQDPQQSGSQYHHMSYESNCPPPMREWECSRPGRKKMSQDYESLLRPKKNAHNLIEKRYRTNLNDKISQLREAVPALRTAHSNPPEDTELDGLSRAHKLNKATILAKAVEYISHLEVRTKELTEENTTLQHRLQEYERTFGGSQMMGRIIVGGMASIMAAGGMSEEDNGHGLFALPYLPLHSVSCLPFLRLAIFIAAMFYVIFPYFLYGSQWYKSYLHRSTLHSSYMFRNPLNYKSWLDPECEYTLKAGWAC